MKWAQWDKTQSRDLLGLFICVCIALCTIVAHNIAQNRPDNFPPYPPDNHHCSDDVYLREGGINQPMTMRTRKRSQYQSQCTVTTSLTDSIDSSTLPVTWRSNGGEPLILLIFKLPWQWHKNIRSTLPVSYPRWLTVGLPPNVFDTLLSLKTHSSLS